MTVTQSDQPVPARNAGRPRSAAADLAIAQATRELLAEVGWSGLTMEAVAHRAGIAKTTLYRRYASPAELAVAAVAGIVAVADTGSHRTTQEDVTSAINAVAEVLSHPEASAAYLAVVSESYRDPDVRKYLDSRVLRPARQLVADGVERAVQRGEVAIEEPEVGPRIDLLFDLLVGAMVHRVLIRRIALDELFLTSLTTAVIAAMHIN